MLFLILDARRPPAVPADPARRWSSETGSGSDFNSQNQHPSNPGPSLATHSDRSGAGATRASITLSTIWPRSSYRLLQAAPLQQRVQILVKGADFSGIDLR